MADFMHLLRFLQEMMPRSQPGKKTTKQAYTFHDSNTCFVSKPDTSTNNIFFFSWSKSSTTKKKKIKRIAASAFSTFRRWRGCYIFWWYVQTLLNFLLLHYDLRQLHYAVAAATPAGPGAFHIAPAAPAGLAGMMIPVQARANVFTFAGIAATVSADAVSWRWSTIFRLRMMSAIFGFVFFVVVMLMVVWWFFDRDRVLLDWMSIILDLIMRFMAAMVVVVRWFSMAVLYFLDLQVVMVMVMAGVQICGVRSLLFITAMMLMNLFMVMASMLISAMRADWLVTVDMLMLMLMASMFAGRVQSNGFFTVAMFMAMASMVIGGRQSVEFFFAGAMLMAMAVMLLGVVQIARICAVVMTIMASMLVCNQLVAWLFAVAMAMAVIMATMLVRRMLVGWLFVMVMLMVVIMTSILCNWWFFATDHWFARTIRTMVGNAMIFLCMRSMMRRRTALLWRSVMRSSTFLRLSTVLLSQQQHAVHDHQQACANICKDGCPDKWMSGKCKPNDCKLRNHREYDVHDDCPMRPPCQPDSLWNPADVIWHQSNVACLHCNSWTRYTHRDSNISFSQCRGIIHAITNHQRRAIFFLEFTNNSHFVLWKKFSMNLSKDISQLPEKKNKSKIRCCNMQNRTTVKTATHTENYFTWFCAYVAAALLSPVSITDLMPSDLSSLMASADPVRQASDRVNTPINSLLHATYPMVTPFISFMSGTTKKKNKKINMRVTKTQDCSTGYLKDHVLVKRKWSKTSIHNY